MYKCSVPRSIFLCKIAINSQLRISFLENSAFPLPLPSSFATPENEGWYIPEACSKINIQQLPAFASAALMNPFKPRVQCSRCLREWYSAMVCAPDTGLVVKQASFQSWDSIPVTTFHASCLKELLQEVLIRCLRTAFGSSFPLPCSGHRSQWGKCY